MEKQLAKRNDCRVGDQDKTDEANRIAIEKRNRDSITGVNAPFFQVNEYQD